MSLSLLALLVLAQPLLSTAEQTGFKTTGRYDEVVSLCRRFERAFPGRAKCSTFGTTPEGRPMVSLAVSGDGTLTPAQAGKKKRPVLLFQGGIHAGEIDGKDAGFLALRELLQRKAPALAAVTVVFVPVFNVDGHERFGPNQRPNQVGPEEGGFRVTAQSLNLNRDFAKAEAPEMAALLGLLNAWDPILHVDLHVTDGAQFEHDVAVLFEPLRDGTELLRPAATALRDALFQKLRAQGHLPLPFYPSFREDDDPTSGFADVPAPPRFALAYWGLRNRIGVLVETHSWRDYPHRVKTTRNVIDGLIELGAVDAAKWTGLALAADKADLAPLEVALRYEPTGKAELIDFLGYAYAREPSQLTSGSTVRYDPSKKEVWKVPLLRELRATVTAKAPLAGYLVPAAHAQWLGAKLALHGFEFERLLTPRTLEVEALRATRFEPQQGSNEGRQPTVVEGTWKKERREVPAGSLFVPVSQPGQRLLLHLLEPAGPDSFVSWGFFNAHFEQREYLEQYVLEPWARQQVAKDPALKKEWDERLKDPAFAGDDRARLRFFAVRHPAWDERYQLYPVLRVDRRP